MKNFKWSLIISLLAGMFYASGFPIFGNFSFILGPFLAFLFFNWALESTFNIKKQFIIGISFSLGFYLTGYYWIPFTLKEFGNIPIPFNYLLGLLFSVFILPQVYFYILIKRRVHSIIQLSLIYALLEFFLPEQFPSHLGHTFISLTPFFSLNFASIFGTTFYSFLICLTSLSLLMHIKRKKAPLKYYSLIALLFILNFIPLPHPTKKSFDLNIRIVQPNVGNFLKLDSERGNLNSIRKIFDDYLDLSTKESKNNLDLIIWPETSYPNLLSSTLLLNNKNYQTPELFKTIINKTGSEMFVGGYDLNPIAQNMFGYESSYNAAFYFSKEAQLKDTYHKIRLIPFGEGLPFGPLNKFLSQYVTNVSFFAKGDSYTQFTLPSGHHFSSAICYEILFPRFISDILNNKKEESQFIVNLTNDSWYGDTQEPYQHLFLSKWRALEFNIPIIRSTNTGISTVIYPDGHESKRLMIFEKNYLDETIKIFERSKTIYQIFGVYLFIGFGIFLIYLEKILLSKDHANE